MGLLRAVFQRVAMRGEVTPFLLAALCMLGQVTGQNFCGVDSRPHPKGICGAMLLRAHRNLCFLLSADYPNIFSRSIHKRSLKNIDDLPLRAYAEMGLSNGAHPDQQSTASSANAESMRKLFQSLLPRVQQQQQQTLLPDSGASHLAPSPGPKAKRGLQDSPRSSSGPRVQKRGMVCDCCYNVCQASILAQYCP